MEQIRFIDLQHLIAFCVTYSSISKKSGFLLAFPNETLVHIAVEQACGNPPLLYFPFVRCGIEKSKTQCQSNGWGHRSMTKHLFYSPTINLQRFQQCLLEILKMLLIEQHGLFKFCSPVQEWLTIWASLLAGSHCCCGRDHFWSSPNGLRVCVCAREWSQRCSRAVTGAFLYLSVSTCVQMPTCSALQTLTPANFLPAGLGWGREALRLGL